MIENILSLFTYYLAFYLEYVNLNSMCGKKHQFRLKIFILILVISIVNYILTITGIFYLKILISFISIYVINRIIIKENPINSLVGSIIYYIITLLFEYMFSLVLVNVLNYNPEKYIASVGIQKCIISYIFDVLTILLFHFKLIKKLYRSFCSLIDKIGVKTSHVYIFLISIFTIEMMYVVNISGKIKFIYTLLYILIFILFILYFSVSLYRNYYLKVLNQYLQEKDEDMQKIIDEYRTFKHNIKNNLIAISSIGNKKTRKMIEEYLNSYTLSTSDNSNISSMPSGLRGIIYQKLISRNKISTPIIVDNYIKNDPMNILSIRVYRTLVESIGIIIDNALEAIDNCDDKYLYMSLLEDDENYNIKCVNPFNNEIDIENIQDKGKTSKKDHSGIGLYYIKNKTQFSLKTLVRNNVYIINLKIKK